MKFSVNSSANVTKFAGNCEFGHNLLNKSLLENFISCAVQPAKSFAKQENCRICGMENESIPEVKQKETAPYIT